MKFMFRPDGKEMFMPIFCRYEDEKEIENSQFKEKIFEFIGTEEKVGRTIRRYQLLYTLCI